MTLSSRRNFAILLLAFSPVLAMAQVRVWQGTFTLLDPEPAGYPADFVFTSDLKWIIREEKIGSGTATLRLYRLSPEGYVPASKKPKLGDHILAFLLRLIPPVGPLRALKFKMPTPAVEKIFMESFNRAVEQYRARLDDSAAPACGSRRG